MMTTEERWVSLRELANHLGMHYQTAWVKAKAGDIPSGRINGKGKWRFRLSEVDASLAATNQDEFAQSPQSRGRRRS